MPAANKTGLPTKFTPRGANFTFAPDKPILGIKEALMKMVDGDRWVLYIPPKLAFGEEGIPDTVGKDEVVVVELHLVKIVGDGRKRVKKCDVELGMGNRAMQKKSGCEKMELEAIEGFTEKNNEELAKEIKEMKYYEDNTLSDDVRMEAKATRRILEKMEKLRKKGVLREGPGTKPPQPPPELLAQMQGDPSMANMPWGPSPIEL